MQLYFIRHAQSENNLLWAQTGSYEGRDEDPTITPVGRKQAQVLAEFLRGPDGGRETLRVDWDSQNVHGFGLTHLYCSLMVRAVETGRVVARALGLPLVAWPGVHETGGIHLRVPDTDEHVGLPGHGRSFFEAHYPELELPDSVGEEGWWNRPFEEFDQRRVRAQHFLDELAERHGGTEERVAVISHGGFYNHVMRCLLRMPENYERWFSINNTAITRIDFEAERTWLCYTNRVDFLPPDLVT